LAGAGSCGRSGCSLNNDYRALAKSISPLTGKKKMSDITMSSREKQ
jgi:hypothetical protein